MAELLRQIRILHLSDVHFGPHHRSAPEDSTASAAGIPPLLSLLRRDLVVANWTDEEWATKRTGNPLIIAVTGDLTERAGDDEFRAATKFLTRLCDIPLLGSKRGVGRDRLFVVPGNHDVVFKATDVAARWKPYCGFHSALLGNVGSRTPVTADDARNLTRVIDLTDKGLVVAEINSCLYVHENTEDANRGQVDHAALASLETQLKAIPRRDLRNSIRVALVHHHPVLLPALVEPGRGYDAVVNSWALLGLLRKHGFHLVLHGHKHHPHTFSYDPLSAWATGPVTPPLLVASGGSTASRELPRRGASCNTYNLISIKWHPGGAQVRARFITRGLVTGDDQEPPPNPSQWHWNTLRADERRLSLAERLPNPDVAKWTGPTPAARAREERRVAMYEKLRGNMPVAEVMPSMIPGQAYEVRLWIVPHHRVELPKRVVWSAGDNFKRAICRRAPDSSFCASLHYYGPMLVQAHMVFDDGTTAEGYVYARIPGRD
jgi:3',5'-cyclic AMP phosphodiesterase CpdA